MIFLPLSGMSLTELSLAGNNLITVFPAMESLVCDIPAGDGKIDNLFYSVIYYRYISKYVRHNCRVSLNKPGIFPLLKYDDEQRQNQICENIA